MTAKIRQLEQQVDPKVVEFLEDRLAAAKRGEITGILILSDEAGAYDFKTIGLRDRMRVIGFLSHAAYKCQDDDT